MPSAGTTGACGGYTAVRTPGLVCAPCALGAIFGAFSMIRISTAIKFAAVASALFLASCTDKPKAVDTASPPTSMSNTTSSSTIVPGSAEDLRVNVGDTVHFDYDAYSVTEEGKGVLQRQAAWLQKYPSVRITVE